MSDSHSVVASAATSCSAVSALAFGALPLLSAIAPDFSVSHPWLFAFGAVAFLSNLMTRVDPLIRAGAALVQAVCVFELLGFCVGVMLLAHTGEAGWRMMDWWAWLVAWGLLGISMAALLLSSLTPRTG